MRHGRAPPEGPHSRNRFSKVSARAASSDAILSSFGESGVAWLRPGPEAPALSPSGCALPGQCSRSAFGALAHRRG